MIISFLRRLLDWVDAPLVDVTSWTPPAVTVDQQTVRCPNCGWDGKSDATPLLADLLEEARRDGARRHCSQADTAHGSMPRVLR